MRQRKIKRRKKFKRMIMFAKRLITKTMDNDVTGMAAQLAYFFLLSLFPLLIFIATLLPYTPLSQDDLFNMIKDFAPEETFNMIQHTLDEIMEGRSGGLLSFGIIGTIWSASNGMNGLMRSLNRAYNVEEKRPYLIARGLAIILTIAMIFVFLLALLVPVFGKQLGMLVFSNLGFSSQFLQIWGIIRWTLTPIILFFVFLFIYFLAPSIKVKFITAAPGALFASLGWIIVSFGFSYYVSEFANYTSTYGSLGAIIVLMLWFYISAIIIMVGGELNSLIRERK
ncbi:YihY/virulence factor BrkB family protein [Lederbergia sp. NSJ-179]|uniref:YihY/virulence factor BrkB family protein n=1 Tax=Lederbergia sp. NSJ-179 TaxID=2931402 RepID=UPI001FD30276|nr:YihY/virulence factor BrkB family protein [Lederbergia sp. NSJ-179]MCJ7840829.1 YihY/virulence factor BrkB family protein [Lederbergia sp. NSJ-179]